MAIVDGRTWEEAGGGATSDRNEVRIALLKQWADQHEKLADNRERRIDVIEGQMFPLMASVTFLTRLVWAMLASIMAQTALILYIGFIYHR